MAIIEIILKVQSCGNNKYRLGISTQDSRDLFQTRGFELMLFLNPDGEGFVTSTKCGPPNDNFDCENCKKAYDLYDSEIHNWITQNGYNIYIPHDPTKLMFLYSQENNSLIFQYRIN